MLLAVSGCSTSGSSSSNSPPKSESTSGRVVGFENDCAVAVEILANNDPTVDQPTDTWVRLEPNSYKKGGTFTSTKLAVLIRLPGAEFAQAYTIETKSMIQVLHGEFDLLFQVMDGFCPT